MKPQAIFRKDTGEQITNPELVRLYHIEQARLALGDSPEAVDMRRRKCEARLTHSVGAGATPTVRRT